MRAGTGQGRDGGCGHATTTPSTAPRPALRRVEILQKIGVTPEVLPSTFPEDLDKAAYTPVRALLLHGL